MTSDKMKQAINTLPVILSVKEIADFFSVTYITILRLIYKKTLSAYKDDDGNWCITRSDFKKYCSKICNL